jgi:hypothetical protein
LQLSIFFFEKEWHMACDLYGMARLHSFEDCERHYNRTEKVCRPAKHWTDSERPLRRVRDSHIKLRKVGEEYHLILFGSTMIEYLPPQGEERTVRIYRRDDYCTITGYLSAHGWYQGKMMPTVDGKTVALMIEPRAYTYPGPSASLLFVEGKLDTSRSYQGMWYKKKLSAASRKVRRLYMQQILPMLQMAVMGCDDPWMKRNRGLRPPDVPPLDLALNPMDTQINLPQIYAAASAFKARTFDHQEMLKKLRKHVVRYLPKATEQYDFTQGPRWPTKDEMPNGDWRWSNVS